MIGDLIEESIEAWHERPIRVIFALLLIETLLVMMIIAGELITTCIVGIIASMLFIGGFLLVFSTKPEYKSAAWMSGIAFLLLWNFAKDIIVLKVSFLNATDLLEITAIAFILIGWFEKNNTKKYAYATIALFYIVATILSH